MDILKNLTLPIYISLIALIVSVTGLITSILNFARKSNTKIHGTYILASSIDCDEKYINLVILENKKDKAIGIMGIYIKIPPNYFIELEDFRDQPLILKPYETITRKYGPVQFYSCNTSKIELNHLFVKNKSGANRKLIIILSTTNGKYIIRKQIEHWFPVIEYFKNNNTGIIIPRHLKHKEKYIGSKIKYVVDFSYSDGEETVLIHEDDFNRSIFKNLRLTKDSLESKQKLTKLFEKAKRDGTLTCKSFEIMEPMKHEYSEKNNIIYAPKLNWFQYYVLGKIYTWLSDIQLNNSNRKMQKTRQGKSDK